MFYFYHYNFKANDVDGLIKFTDLEEIELPKVSTVWGSTKLKLK